MEKSEALLALAALAQDSRLDIFRLLVRSLPDGVPAGQISDALGLPAATLSFHLGQLKSAALIDCRRDGRQLIYSAAYPTMSALLGYLSDECCGGHPSACLPTQPLNGDRIMADPHEPSRVYNVLFLCTGNSARSILAEGILRKDGAAHFRAFSAGSHPKGAVNPLALKVLESFDYPTDNMRSKSWSEYATADAPVMDFVFTVCDDAAGEVCPIWPGQPMTAHWGVPDPAAADGSDLQKEAAFVTAFRQLKNRIGVFAALPLASIDSLSLGNRLREIGLMEGTTRPKAS